MLGYCFVSQFCKILPNVRFYSVSLLNKTNIFTMASMRENLSKGFANSNGADQPVYPQSDQRHC